MFYHSRLWWICTCIMEIFVNVYIDFILFTEDVECENFRSTGNIRIGQLREHNNNMMNTKKYPKSIEFPTKLSRISLKIIIVIIKYLI